MLWLYIWQAIEWRLKLNQFKLNQSKAGKKLIATTTQWHIIINNLLVILRVLLSIAWLLSLFNSHILASCSVLKCGSMSTQNSQQENTIEPWTLCHFDHTQFKTLSAKIFHFPFVYYWRRWWINWLQLINWPMQRSIPPHGQCSNPFYSDVCEAVFTSSNSPPKPNQITNCHGHLIMLKWVKWPR